MSASTEFAASLPFLSYKQRNAVLDNFFYDTGSLTVEEKAKLSPLIDREGSIVVVPPSNSDRQIRHYKRALRFMNKEGPTIRAIAVAGVGSSALGTAALARSIADALDTDVAGIITGYGLSDVMTEALGGWFVFGAADRIRFAMEKFFERMRTTMPADIVSAGSEASAMWFDRSSLPGDNDVSTLSEILLAGPPALEYLITHSKGSLVASYALQQYVEDLEGDETALFERLRITTLGAVVGLPAVFKNVKQYLGALDWFGGANSSLGVTHERVPGVSHHLNPGFPYHMSVAALLNGGAAPRLLPKPALEELLAPLSFPPVEVRKAKPAPMTVVAKPKEPVRKPEKKMAKPAAPAPRVASPAPRIVSSTAKPASAAAKVARPAPKIVSAAPKSPVAAARQPSAAAKQAVKPVPTKVPVAPHRPVPPVKAKTAAANGKLVVKKSKKEMR
jgi:hypothetical protein